MFPFYEEKYLDLQISTGTGMNFPPIFIVPSKSSSSKKELSTPSVPIPFIP